LLCKYSTISLTLSSTLFKSLLMWISAFSGASYGALMPVNSGILPLGSRASATSRGMSTKTSTKARGSSEPVVTACRSRAVARSALYGEMKDVMAIVDESANSLATWKK
jgi:hypothetical protein